MIISKARFNGLWVEGFILVSEFKSTPKRAENQSAGRSQRPKRWAINPSG
jgi:hypothetical protein